MTSEKENTGQNSRDDIHEKVGDIHIRVSGMNDEEKMDRDVVYGEIVKALTKIKRMTDATDFVLNVKKYHEEGSRKKYSINASIKCGLGSFHADDTDWGMIKTSKSVLEKLEREIYKADDMVKNHKA